MHRWIAWALAALVFAMAAAWADVAPPATADDEVALIKQGIKAYEDKKPAEAAKLLKIAVESPTLQLITPEGQYVTNRILASAAYDSEDYQTSARAARAATAHAKADADDWEMRVWASWAVQDGIDVITSMTTLAAKWPDRMNRFRLRMIGRVVNEVEDRPGGEELVARLMQALLAAKWTPSGDLPLSADWLWVKLVRFDLKWKALAEANAVAARIEDPDALRLMQVDNVFDEIVAADPARFDSDKAAERLVRATKKWADDHPDELEAVLGAAMALYAVDRSSEALALLDDAKARIEKRGKDAFKDLEEQHNWLFDARWRVLIALGRNQEGLAELEAGAKLNEDGNQNVSQILNLAHAYVGAGRPADALAMLKRMDPAHTSEYGRMVYETARACAYAQQNDAKGLADAMAFITAYSGDSVGAKAEAMLCADDIDGAARHVIAQLQDADRRGDIIAALQEHALPRLAVLPAFKKLMRQRWEALRNRQDVLEAIKPYGRIMSFKTVE